MLRNLTNLLAQDIPFHFSKECLKEFNRLKEALTFAFILHPLIWREPFALMCDASNYAIGVVLGQHVDRTACYILCESYFE